MDPFRDAIGLWGDVKFSVPTVANGHVYAGTFGRVNIYGLLSGNGKPDIPINLVAQSGAQVSLTWLAANGATSYNVYRSTESNGEGSPPLQTGVAGISFTDTSLVVSNTYYKVTAVNAAGESPQSVEASVTYVPIFTTITISPSSASIKTGATQQFTATAKDQNGQPMPTQPAFTWTAPSGGAINSTGLFTASATPGGPFTVTAAAGGKSGTASVVVISNGLNDFNGDGKPDLVMQNTAINKAAVWYLNGTTVTGSAYLSINLPAGWKIVGDGDFNGDGKPDLVLQNAATRQIVLWYMNGATVTNGAYISSTPAAGWAVVGVADVNHDGKPDLVLQNSTTGQIAFWYLNGPLLTGGAYVSLTPGMGWKVIGGGDFNGDGKLDLALLNTSTNQVAIWYLNGATVINGGYISNTPPLTWKPVGIADFNNDGKPDLILQSTSTNQIAFWYLNNAALQSGAFVSLTPASGWSVAAPH